MNTAQLALIRDTTSLPDGPGVLSTLQASALAFADESTKDVKVRPEVTEALQQGLAAYVDSHTGCSTKSKEYEIQDLLVEAAAVVATYNMVSRFLVSLDVAGMSDELVPWPADRTEVS